MKPLTYIPLLDDHGGLVVQFQVSPVNDLTMTSK